MFSVQSFFEFYYYLLSDKNPNVRRKAAETLGKLGDKTCLPRLKEVLKQESEASVIAAIKEAIAKLEA